MNEIRISISAKNYANALVQMGQEKIISHGDILKNLEQIKEILQASPDLNEVFVNPTIPEETKYSITDEVFSKSIDEKIIKFIKILVNKKRFNEFEMILEAYKKVLDEINNVKRVEIVSAIELKGELKDKIINKLEDKLQKSVVVQWQASKDIIGGLVIKIEDDVIDTSLKNKLENLGKNITI